MNEDELQRHIRCKCGKYWGMRNHNRNCKRCKTTVIARGEKNEKEKSNISKVN